MPELLNRKPRGELVLRTLAMPKDTNANGDIFGGWIVSQMDLGAGIAAKARSRGRAATVAIDKMTFKRPLRIGDVVSCYAAIDHVGRTSMTISIEIWAEHAANVADDLQLFTEGTFIFVAIDEYGQPRPVDEP
jgi:acyl-CoA thioesterase YciA